MGGGEACRWGVMSWVAAGAARHDDMGGRLDDFDRVRWLTRQTEPRLVSCQKGDYREGAGLEMCCPSRLMPIPEMCPLELDEASVAFEQEMCPPVPPPKEEMCCCANGRCAPSFHAPSTSFEASSFNVNERVRAGCPDEGSQPRDVLRGSHDAVPASEPIVYLEHVSLAVGDSEYLPEAGPADGTAASRNGRLLFASSEEACTFSAIVGGVGL